MKDNNEMNDPTKLLSSIKKVEAPPFLLTRINEKINADRHESISPKWAWSLSVSFIVILAINVWIIKSEVISSDDSSSVLIESMNMNTVYEIY